MCSSFWPCKEGEKPELCIPPLLPDYAQQRKSIPISMNGVHHYFACQLVQSFIRTRLPGSLGTAHSDHLEYFQFIFISNAYLSDLYCRLYKLGTANFMHRDAGIAIVVQCGSVLWLVHTVYQLIAHYAGIQSYTTLEIINLLAFVRRLIHR